MNAADMLAICKAWADEYNPEIADRITECKWEAIEGTVFAHCVYVNGTAWIGMNVKCDTCPDWFLRSLLWHEYCHAEAYLEDCESDAHKEHWREYRRRKWFYLLGEYLGEFLYSSRLW